MAQKRTTVVVKNVMEVTHDTSLRDEEVLVRAEECVYADMENERMGVKWVTAESEISRREDTQ